MPDWLRESPWHWIRDRLTPVVPVQTALLREVERVLEIPLGWDGGSSQQGVMRLRAALLANQGQMLDVAEFLAVRRADDDGRATLERILAESGSVWRVGSDGLFTERVTPTAQEAADARFGEGTAGELLRLAWGEAFGRDPNPSEAYRHAVRAVEAAAKDVVIPRSPRPTLGTIIAALRDGAGKFTLAFVVDSKVKPLDVLVAMMEMLWTNQYDRHVNDDTPLHVSQAEAEAAVTLALTLVEWFASGKVVRVE